MRLLRSAALFVWRLICRLLGRNMDMPKISHIVMFNSPEFVCLHEGHAVTALSVGARVVELELYREKPRSYGGTRADRTGASGAGHCARRLLRSSTCASSLTGL